MFRLSDYFFVKMEEAQGGEGGQAASTSIVSDDPNSGAGDDNSGSDDSANSDVGESGSEAGEGGDNTGGQDQGDGGDNVERPEWLPEGFETPEDMAAAYKELKEGGNAFSGAPEEGYALNLPEGADDFQFFESEQGSVEQFKTLAAKMGVNQEQFDSLLAFYVDSRIYEDSLAIQNTHKASLELIGGQERLDTISAKVKAAMSEDDYKLVQMAASNAPQAPGAVIKLMEKFVLNGETPPMGNASAAQSAGVSRVELKEMMKDPRYKTDKDFRAQVTEGFKRLHANK